MKQATRTKNNTTSQALATHLKHRLREGTFILIIAIALYFFLAFMTYQPSDPGWSSTGLNKHVANAGGQVGAWIADLFLCIFGYMAYLFPIMLLYSGWKFLKAKSVDFFDLHSMILRLLGLMLVLIAGSGLLTLQLPHLHTHLPFMAGGIVGDLLSSNLVVIFNPTGCTLFLVALCFSGTTLFTGLSWFKMLDRIGSAALQLITGLKQCCKSLYTRLRGSLQNARASKKMKARDLQMENEPTLKLEIKSKSKNKLLSNTPPLNTEPRKNLKRFTENKNSISHEAESPLDTKNSLKKIRAQKTETPQVIKSVEPATNNAQIRIDHNKDSGLPSIDLLDQPTVGQQPKGYSNAVLEEMSREVERKLKDFGIEIQVVAVHPGPVITRFEMQLAAGLKVSRITSLVKDLARSLSVVSVRVVEVIPGKSFVGLELPNEDREVVRLSEILASSQYDQMRSPLALTLGKDIAGYPVVVDLAKMPHLLVAGTTGSGKSVGVNAMILGLLYKSLPTEVRLILIDPKMLELSIYEGIPHLLTPVVTDMRKAGNALNWCVLEMERRYRLMAALGVRNLANFNQKLKEAEERGEPLSDPLWQGEPEECPLLETLPYIVVVIDEYADMMMVVGKKVEQLIARLAQKARAAGMHLILATQRPSVVITGLIKANIPTRIAYQVSSKIDSRTIIDQAGAEQLLGHGDLLYLPPGTSIPVRVHGAYVADHEVHKVVSDWKKRGTPNYVYEILDQTSSGLGYGSEDNNGEDAEKDPLYDQAVHIVTLTRRASISNIQRRLKIGYNRAARMIEEMEVAGVVGAMESNGSREVLAPPPVED